MKKFKFYVFAPDNDRQINKIISAAAEAGAGIIGDYTHCAFIQKGQGNWFSGEGASPHVGKVGEMSRENEVKIEMECTADVAHLVSGAIKDVHPYESVVIDFVELVEIE